MCLRELDAECVVADKTLKRLFCESGGPNNAVSGTITAAHNTNAS